MSAAGLNEGCAGLPEMRDGPGVRAFRGLAAGARWSARRLYPFGRWGLGALACLTPVTAIAPLGWIMGDMRRRLAARGRVLAERRGAPAPSWAAAAPEEDFWGASLRNLSEGLAAALTLAAGVLPFALLWLLGWWGGWETSFSKGYERAWVGPTVSLIGLALAPPLLARLPMALAHQAAERRMSAFFERRPVARLIGLAGWSYLGLALLTALAAAPLLFAKAAPVFIERIRPDVMAMSPEEIDAFRGAWRFWTAVYLIAAYALLKRLAARIYARARIRREAGEAPGLGGPLRHPLLWLIWLALAAQVYVGQFFNHEWAFWLNPPLTFLPWVPALGG